MHPLLLAAEDCQPCRHDIVSLGPRLSESSDELDDLLSAAVEQSLDYGFTNLSLAALHVELPVDARHLSGGAHLLPEPGILARIAGHCQGDVAGALIEAVQEARLSWERAGTALLLGAWWDQERGDGSHRKELVREARLLCRRSLSLTGGLLVLATAQILDDGELSELASRSAPSYFGEDAHSIRTSILELATQPVMEGLPDRPQQADFDWRPMRRAAPRIGRNEPCPCGSGKKYKRCCLARDQRRLRDSSDVEGVTRSELRRNLEEHLTWDRVDELRAHELARLDPRRIDPGLCLAVLRKLILFNEFQAALRFFQTDDVAPELKAHLLDAVEAALRQRRPEEAKALLEHVDEPLDEAWMSLGLLMLTKGLEESPLLDEIELRARNTADEAAVDLACELLESRWPHLGILVARGVLPLSQGFEHEVLLSSIGEARDYLDLPVVDPIEEVLDSWSGEELDPQTRRREDLAPGALQASDRAWGIDDTEPAASDGSPAAADEKPPEAPQSSDAEHSRALEEKEEEVRRLRAQLAELSAQLREQDERDRTATEESRSETDPRLLALRERVHRLKSELNQRHAERNRFRRQVEILRKRVDAVKALREDPPKAAEAETAAAATEPPEELAGPVPVRLPRFSKRFREKLAAVPDAIGRRAVLTAGRIAAGDPAALRGARRLHTDRDLHRQRIGRDYRMLFRLHEDEIEVVDLLPRQDLDRALKSLR